MPDTNASWLPAAAWKPFTIGKSVDWVPPVIHILPWESTAIAFALSLPLPPKYVE